MTDVPDLLTVEEAARYLRIGRTKAYALAREWRSSDGRSGLPVIDLGHVLRVPRRHLEQVIGAPLTGVIPDAVILGPNTPVSEPPVASSAGDGAPVGGDSTSTEGWTTPPPKVSRPRRRHARPTSQLDLFDTSLTTISAGR